MRGTSNQVLREHMRTLCILQRWIWSLDPLPVGIRLPERVKQERRREERNTYLPTVQQMLRSRYGVDKEKRKVSVKYRERAGVRAGYSP